MADTPNTDQSDESENAKPISPESTAPIDEPETEHAVDDIMRHDSDEVIAAEDAKQSKVPDQPWYKKIFSQKKVWIPLAVVLVLIIIGAVPYTRYKALGLFWKQTYKLAVVDSQTKLPVSDASITLDGKAMTTNNKGQATIKVSVGSQKLTISKKYYASLSRGVLVGLRSKGTQTLQLQAIGRQVPLKVVNIISGLPISNVEISAAGTSAKTDKNGQVTIVLPADKTQAAATVSGSGYNNLATTIQITASVVPDNTFKLAPGGKVYFLSNASGNIDVVSTNLDGSNRQTVLAGTGNEDPNNTILLNSPDWKYLALLTQRTSDSTQDAIYLISTSDNKLTTLDNGTNVNFNPIGWSNNDYFVYTVDHPNVSPWQSGATTLKSYNAANGQITMLDQTQGAGTSQSDYAEQMFDQTYIFGSSILYSKSWQSSYYSPNEMQGKTNVIMSISANNTDKQTLKSLAVPANDTYTYIDSEQVGPQSVDFQVPNSNDNSSTLYYEYQGNNSTTMATITEDDYTQATKNTSQYQLSPSGDQLLTAQIRDGQLVLQVGANSDSTPATVASLSTDYSFYGWYTNDYLLVSYKNSQLYILPVSGLKNGAGPLKMTDYFQGNYGGYNSGKGE